MKEVEYSNVVHRKAKRIATLVKPFQGHEKLKKSFEKNNSMQVKDDPKNGTEKHGIEKIGTDKLGTEKLGTEKNTEKDLKNQISAIFDKNKCEYDDLQMMKIKYFSEKELLLEEKYPDFLKIYEGINDNEKVTVQLKTLKSMLTGNFNKINIEGDTQKSKRHRFSFQNNTTLRSTKHIEDQQLIIDNEFFLTTFFSDKKVNREFFLTILRPDNKKTKLSLILHAGICFPEIFHQVFFFSTNNPFFFPLLIFRLALFIINLLIAKFLQFQKIHESIFLKLYFLSIQSIIQVLYFFTNHEGIKSFLELIFVYSFVVKSNTFNFKQSFFLSLFQIIGFLVGISIFNIVDNFLWIEFVIFFTIACFHLLEKYEDQKLCIAKFNMKKKNLILKRKCDNLMTNLLPMHVS